MNYDAKDSYYHLEWNITYNKTSRNMKICFNIAYIFWRIERVSEMKRVDYGPLPFERESVFVEEAEDLLPDVDTIGVEN